MKKIIIPVFMAIVLAFSLVGCGNKDKGKVDSTTTSTTESTTETSTSTTEMTSTTENSTDNKNDNNMELENTANYEKLDEEIKKTNEFLKVLKELQKKLD